MSFTSYAQNLEDVILARALRHVDCGFYIDIGAQDPVKYSVTKAFYEIGWHGVNIEPVSHWFQLLEKDRVRDTNLNVAVADTPGYLHLYEIVDTGLSTTEEVFARRHAAAGFEVKEVEVPCVTLDTICVENRVGEVHFLKVDCEGSETLAFRGFSFNTVRPWIVVVEATEPLSQEPAYAEWEPILFDHDYHFVYADGLNRFYVADEHAELNAAFVFPPNVFDDFVLAAEVGVRQQLESALIDRLEWCKRAEYLDGENERREVALVEHRAMLAVSAQSMAELQLRLHESDQHHSLMLEEALSLKNEVAHLHHEVAARDREVGRLGHEVAARDREVGRLGHEVAARDGEVGRLHHEIAARDREIVCLTESVQAIHHSTSWRVTRPLRFIRRFGGSLWKGFFRSPYPWVRRSMRFARPLLRKLVQLVWLRSFLVRLVGTDSELVGRSRLFLFGSGVEEYQSTHQEQQAPGQTSRDESLTWQASRVNEEIQQALARRVREHNPQHSKGD